MVQRPLIVHNGGHYGLSRYGQPTFLHGGIAMFSQTLEYALRAMAQLASEAPRSATTQSLAKSTGVPAAYLSKVLQTLRTGGLVKCRRGVGGGVQLARTPKQISLLDVVNAV